MDMGFASFGDGKNEEDFLLLLAKYPLPWI